MPAQLSNVAIQQFHDTFTNAYQATSQLEGTSQLVSGVRGDSYRWPLQGDAPMVLRNAYQSLIPVSSNDYAQVQTSFENYLLNLPVDIFQQAELLIDTLAQLGTVHAKSAGRREDQFMLDALYASIAAGTGPHPQLPDQEPPGVILGDVGAATVTPVPPTLSVNLNVDKIVAAAVLLDKANVPPEDRYLAVNAAMMGSLLSNGDKPVNILYNNTKNLMQGGVDTFMGFKIITLGDRSEGGIAVRAANVPAGVPGLVSGTNKSAIAWHKDTLGVCYSLNPVTEIEWSPTHQSWLTISRLRMGASTLLGKGVVFIDCNDEVGPTHPPT